MVAATRNTRANSGHANKAQHSTNLKSRTETETIGLRHQISHEISMQATSCNEIENAQQAHVTGAGGKERGSTLCVVMN